jgi:Spy/CpxP family protein refolding chaperone
MNEKKDAMINLLGSGGVKPNRINTLRREMTAIQGDIEKTVIDHVLDVKAVLDPRQRERFFDLLRKSMHQEPGMFIRSGEE